MSQVSFIQSKAIVQVNYDITSDRGRMSEDAHGLQVDAWRLLLWRTEEGRQFCKCCGASVGLCFGVTG